MTIASIIYGLFGFMLGTTTRSSAISIAAGVAWFLLGETLPIQPLWDQAEKWFPAGVLSSVAGGGTEAAPYGTAVVLALVYGAIAWAISVLVLQRRDIVD